jgi:small subunit ribosomal protein S6
VREYETTFIVQPEISDEGAQSILSRLDEVLESGGATRLELDDIGKRKLAYEIRKFQKGHYYMLSYLDGGAVVPAVERMLRLDDSVLRFLTVQASPLVKDVEGRKAYAAEQERIRKERAAERAAREAEEEKARQEAEAQAAAERAEAAAAAEERAGEADEAPASEAPAAQAAEATPVAPAAPEAPAEEEVTS